MNTDAVLPPDTAEGGVGGLHGFMRGTVIVPPDVDLTAPVLAEALTTESGVLDE